MCGTFLWGLLILSALSWLCYRAYKWKMSYWYRRGVPNPPPTFLFGNTKGLLTQTESFGDFCHNSYKYFKAHKVPHGGFYLGVIPIYMPIDLHLVQSIMQDDFSHFVDRGVYFDEDFDPLSAHLFSLEGTKWRELRTKLTPTFTSGKMKMMFETLIKCGEQLKAQMELNLGSGPIDIKEILSRFTTDIIGNCAFGIDCNSMQNPENEFTSHLELFFRKELKDHILTFLTFAAPDFMKRFKTKAVNPVCSTFFLKIISETVRYREENNVFRKDFMHLLLQLKNRGELADDEDVLSTNTGKKALTLTFNEIAAQAFIFFLAGFETSATTITFCLFELALNGRVQGKVREEINQVLARYAGEITYEALMEMEYLEQVINETLRKYPPLPGYNRVCTKEYPVPGTDVVIEKGTKVFIPVIGIQRDPMWYPNPERFDPERFSDTNKKNRCSTTYMPFGKGPRVCIGLRFGLMETKIGVIALLKNYDFSVNARTKSPIEFDPRTGILCAAGGIWLNYKKVSCN